MCQTVAGTLPRPRKKIRLRMPSSRFGERNLRNGNCESFSTIHTKKSSNCNRYFIKTHAFWYEDAEDYFFQGSTKQPEKWILGSHMWIIVLLLPTRNLKPFKTYLLNAFRLDKKRTFKKTTGHCSYVVRPFILFLME